VVIWPFFKGELRRFKRNSDKRLESKHLCQKSNEITKAIEPKIAKRRCEESKKVQINDLERANRRIDKNSLKRG
jgi:hypothetical protein